MALLPQPPLREGRRKTGRRALLCPISGQLQRPQSGGTSQSGSGGRAPFPLPIWLLDTHASLCHPGQLPVLSWGTPAGRQTVPLCGHLCRGCVLLSAKGFLCHHPGAHSSTWSGAVKTHAHLTPGKLTQFDFELLPGALAGAATPPASSSLSSPFSSGPTSWISLFSPL